MDKQMSRMHRNMTEAQRQVDQFQATADTKSRRKLMTEHMHMMQMLLEQIMQQEQMLTESIPAAGRP